MEKKLLDVLNQTKHYLTDYHREIIVREMEGKPEEQRKMIDFIKKYSGTKDLVVMDYLDLLIEPHTQKELAAALRKVPGMNADLTQAYIQELHNDRWKEQKLLRFIEDVSKAETDDIADYISGPLQRFGELRNRLRLVSDAYTDFVDGIMNALGADEEQVEKMLWYIRENPENKTDDCIEFLEKYIEGVKEED